MAYSIKPVLHAFETADKQHSIIIQVIYKSMKVYTASGYKVKKTEFEKGLVIKRTNAKEINFNIKVKVSEIESRLIEAMKFSKQITKDQLKAIVENQNFNPSKKVADYIKEILRKYHMVPGRMNHYLSIGHKLETFRPGASLSDIDAGFIQEFEAYLRQTTKEVDGKLIQIDGNTVKSNITILKSILNKAVKDNLIESKQFQAYKNPKYTQKIPEYLTEAEITRLEEETIQLPAGGYKRACYYFLLSCYTGYRLSDSIAFNYSEMVNDGQIVLRTKKNKQIVSIPVHSRLETILQYVKSNPLNLSEQKVRSYVKEICRRIGINKNVKFHTARHSWAMLLMSKGFSVEEVAETLGDSLNIAKVYARISNEQLSGKIKDLLG